MKKRFPFLHPLGLIGHNYFLPHFKVSLIMTGKFELSLGESPIGAPSMGPQHEAHRSTNRLHHVLKSYCTGLQSQRYLMGSPTLYFSGPIWQVVRNLESWQFLHTCTDDASLFLD